MSQSSRNAKDGKGNGNGKAEGWRNVKVREGTYQRLIDYESFFQLKEGKKLSINETVEILMSFAPKYRLMAEKI